MSSPLSTPDESSNDVNPRLTDVVHVNALTGSILVSWESFAMSSRETQYRAWDPTTLMVHCRWLPDCLVFEGKEKARKAVARVVDGGVVGGTHCGLGWRRGVGPRGAGRVCGWDGGFHDWHD